LSHCGFWLRRVELELLLARKRRLESERRCYELAKQCLEAIRRIDERLKELMDDE